MFLTETSGLCGIVAANCHVLSGDEVTILAGGPTPFVLRRIFCNKVSSNHALLFGW